MTSDTSAAPTPSHGYRLTERLAAGELVLLDGGTGTELERAGVPMREGAWCGTTALEFATETQRVHEIHIEAGAEVITANAYASSKHLLESVDMGHEFAAINEAAVKNAIRAREVTGTQERVAVAGSISTTEMFGEKPPIDVARANYLEQAKIQADSGAELIMLEMMRDIEHTAAAIDGVLATRLPVWVGYSCFLAGPEDADVAEPGTPLLFHRQHTLADALDALAPYGDQIGAVSIMHSESNIIDSCIDVLDDHWHGPVGVYAQTGTFNPPNWVFIDTITPADYTTACQRWVERGVQLIGGCCGIGPEHITDLAANLSG